MLHLFSFSTHTKSLFIPYAYVSFKSIDFILLSYFKLGTILLISSVKTLGLLLLNLCGIFNTNLLFLMNCQSLSISISFLRNGIFFFYSQFQLLLNSSYNLEIQVIFLWYTFLCLLLFNLHHCWFLNSSVFVLLIQQILSRFFHLIHLSLVQLLFLFFPLDNDLPNSLFETSNFISAFSVISF